ncbi:AMP-binding protein [Actinoplanes sp. NPDC049596]|uniref:AMP-binding protein n=1 Tax=unclassified Actinoplanes TaxID=2626549 RepID=UPI003445D2F3
MRENLGDFRAPQALVDRYHAAGLWRSTGPVSDLERWRRVRPDGIAIVQYNDGVQTVRMSYEQYAAKVERFAAALHELGVRPGDVVAVQLPNLWQASVLMVACARVKAVLAPVMPTIRPRELSRMLDRLGAVVCVTIQDWDGYDLAAALASVAPALPALRHRVVLGARDPGDLDLTDFFERTPWEMTHPMGLGEADEDPDRLAVVFFTSGTTGRPKAAMHSLNTLHAGIKPIVDAERMGPQDVMFIPHAITHLAGFKADITMTLLSGATTVLLDRWDASTGARLLAEAGVTMMFGAPVFFRDLVMTPPTMPLRLRMALAGATAIPQPLVDQVREVLGTFLRASWGMTELAAQTWTRADDPPDWATRSDGSPGPGLEIQLRADHEVTREHPAELHVRGAGVALATLGRDSGTLNVLAAHDNGWYDTGDLAIPDGRDGIRIVGRAADRIGGIFMIPVNDVESELLRHPAVADVAVVGYVDESGAESGSAVVVPRGAPPALADLRAFLSARGMTDLYQPTHLLVIDRLPRNSAGKVRKDLLRKRVQDSLQNA